MPGFLLRRFLWLWPTLWLITVLTFMLTALAPDPLSNFAEDCDLMGSGSSYADFERCLAEKRAQYGLDRPRFYFTVTSLAQPADFYQQPRHLRPTLRQLLFEVGDWTKVQAYRQALDGLMRTSSQQRLAGTLALSIDRLVLGLRSMGAMTAVEARLDSLATLAQRHEGPWVSALQETQQRYAAMQSGPARWRNFVPTLHWYGTNNQYHHWLTGMLQGDLGRSYRRDQAVGTTIRELMPWTLTFAALGTLLIFLTGIPIGVVAAMYPGTLWDRGTALLGFVLEVIPTFWLGTLLFVYFADPEMAGGGFLTAGLRPDQLRWEQYLTQMPLPLIAYAYAGFAQLSRLLRSTLQEQMQTAYLRTALAKGLSHRRAVWRHALRNSLLPLITVATGVLPSLLAGAVVVEQVFLIRGLGRETLEAVTSNDVPFVMAIFSLVAVATLLGYFLADLLYAWVDPRVSESLT